MTTTIDMNIRTRKLIDLESARRRYVQALYSYLPCLEMPDEIGTARHIIDIVGSIAELHDCIALDTMPKTPASPPALSASIVAVDSAPVAPLTEGEQTELRTLINQHGIYAAADPDTHELTVTHPSISGIFHPLNERELLEVARDIASKAGE